LQALVASTYWKVSSVLSSFRTEPVFVPLPFTVKFENGSLAMNSDEPEHPLGADVAVADAVGVGVEVAI
jgi:hypothetical protein